MFVIRLEVKSLSFLVLYVPLNADELKIMQKPFYFTPELLLRYFTWKMDNNGRFCDVPKELAEIVGPIFFLILGSYFYGFVNQFHDERYQLLSGLSEAAAP